MNTWLEPGTSLIAQSIGWALLYSLWQGMLISAALFVLLKLLKNASARIRYNISMFLFSGFSVWFADTWFNEWQRLQKITVLVTESSVDAGTVSTTSFTTLPYNHGSNQFLQQFQPWLEKYMPLIVAVYIIGLLFMVSRFLLNILKLRTLRKKSITQVDEKLSKLFAQWKVQLNINRPVKFFLSKRINVPMMMGYIKPVILLPAASISQLSTDQLEAILLHELAHIKRNDYLLNIFQTIVETVLFFNPFVWWMSSVIRQEREHCCDDLVVANTSSTLPYASALATLESQRLLGNNMVIAASGQKNQLFNRIKRIMEMKKNPINYAQLGTAIILILILAVSISWLTPGFAQKTATQYNNPKKETKTQQKIVITDDEGNTKEYDSIDQLPKSEKDKLRKELDKEEKKNNKIVKKETIIKNNDNKNKADDDKDVDLIVKQALNDVDFDKIGKEVNEALKEVGDAMKEVGNSLKEVDWNEVSKNLQAKLEDIKKQLPDTGNEKVMTTKIRKKIDETGHAFDEITEKIEKSKHSSSSSSSSSSSYAYANTDSDNDNKKIHVSAPAYDNMLKKMESDGLIDRVNGYNIEKKGDRLFINDVEQANSTFNKYAHYFKNKEVIVKGDKDHIKINVKD